MATLWDTYTKADKAKIYTENKAKQKYFQVNAIENYIKIRVI